MSERADKEWEVVLLAMSCTGSRSMPGVDFEFSDPVTEECIDAMNWTGLRDGDNPTADRAWFTELYDQIATLRQAIGPRTIVDMRRNAMTKLIAIDPGPIESAYVRLGYDGSMLAFGKAPNDEIKRIVEQSRHRSAHLAVEMIASYGMPVGFEVFETCVWIGRFVEAWTLDHTRMYRRAVKVHLCGTAKAKDGNVRQALLDRWGGKAIAVGSKRNPGQLYGVSKDVWQALAVAVTWWDANVNDGERLGARTEAA